MSNERRVLHGVGCFAGLVFIILALILLMGGTGCTASYTASQTVEEDRAEWDQPILVREKDSIREGDYLFLVDGDIVAIYETEIINPSYGDIACIPQWEKGELRGKRVSLVQITVVTVNHYSDFTTVKIQLPDGCQGWVSAGFLYAADS